MADPQLVILGAGPPFTGTTHSALRYVDRSTVVLDWVLQAFDAMHPRVSFVTGYDAQDVMARGGGRVSYVVNEDWRETGAAGSLAKVQLAPEAANWVCYSDIVFGRDVVEALERADTASVVVAVDGASRNPGKERFGEVEFVGLLRLPAGADETLRRVMYERPELAKGHLSGLVGALREAGLNVTTVDVGGRWSDLNSDADLTAFILGTKAETLGRLRGLVTRSVVGPQVSFRVSEWRSAPDDWTGRALELPGSALIVRSSALTEDSFESANAGRYTSVLDVQPSEAEVRSAVEEVIASFDSDGLDHQVLVQPMVADVARAGVVLTRALHTGAAYYRVSFAAADTTAITAGDPGLATTWVIHRELAETVPGEIEPILAAVREVEEILDYDALDIEFAETQSGELHLLQVRPIVLDHDRTIGSEAEVAATIQAARARFGELSPASVWSCMSDWNPAEIIGVVPSRLAFSLYRELVTDDVWSRQRAEFGYADLGALPLVRLFAGHAFVDVRASINSFVPAALEGDDAERIVEAALARLAEQPDLHDKIEFAVVPTCFDFDFDRWRSLVGDEGFDRIADAYRALTAAAIERIGDDEAAVGALGGSGAPSGNRLDRIRALLDDVRAHGTLPFAHLARHGFIAVSLLRSAVTKEALTQERADEFLASIHTVSGEFLADAWRVKSGDLPRDEFAARYGHLRPGTYDITSRSYSANPAQYLDPIVEQATEPPARQFSWTAAEGEALARLLDDSGLGIDVVALDGYIRRAIEGRERIKFLFTRQLSLALDEIEAFGAELGIGPEELEDVSLADLMEVRGGALTQPDAAEHLRAAAGAGRVARRRAAAVILPSVIRDAGEFTVFRTFPDEPTFVTHKSVSGPTAVVDGDGPPDDLTGAIVVVERADPGWDWLFGHKIAGLITAYGGSNSHMAIRAAEFDLPAAVGVGPERFSELRSARTVELDCARRRIVRVA